LFRFFLGCSALHRFFSLVFSFLHEHFFLVAVGGVEHVESCFTWNRVLSSIFIRQQGGARRIVFFHQFSCDSEAQACRFGEVAAGWWRLNQATKNIFASLDRIPASSDEAGSESRAAVTANLHRAINKKEAAQTNNNAPF